MAPSQLRVRAAFPGHGRRAVREGTSRELMTTRCRRWEEREPGDGWRSSEASLAAFQRSRADPGRAGCEGSSREERAASRGRRKRAASASLAFLSVRKSMRALVLEASSASVSLTLACVRK